MKRNLFLWGSCVARDVVRVTEQFDLEYYVGRQSIISGFSHGIPDPGPTNLKSNFQDRALRQDFTSNGRKRLTNGLPNADAVILDLATERRGVYQVGEDRFLTNTIELKQSGLLDRFKDHELLEFGSDIHRRLFEKAARSLCNEIDRSGKLEVTAVINAPFTDVAKEGGIIRPNLGKTASEWNELFPEYHAIFRELGITVFDEPPRDLILSTSEHAWGLDIDHYIDETYFFWANQIESLVEKHEL